MASRFPASAAERWLNCLGSVELCAGLPQGPSNEYMAEGTAAHLICEKALRSGLTAETYVGKFVRVARVGYDTALIEDWEAEGSNADWFEFEVTEEMAEHVQVYLDTVNALIAGTKHAKLEIEKFIDLNHISSEMRGKLDAVIDRGAEVIIVDFKYGQGNAVEVEHNPQLLYYLAAEVLERHKKQKIVVVQPRAPHPDGPVRAWDVDEKTLAAFIDSLYRAVEKANNGDYTYNPGDWCKWCPANSICTAHQKHNASLARLDFADKDAVPVNPKELTPVDLANILNHEGALLAWLKACKEAAANLLTAGEKVPGYKLVHTYGHRKWTDPEAAEKALRGKGFKKADVTKSQLISPAQAEKLKGGRITKQDLATLVDELSTKPATGPTLVPESDKRPAVATAIEDFADSTDEDWLQ